MHAKPPYGCSTSSGGLLAAVGFKSKLKNELKRKKSIRKPIGQMTLEDLNESGNTSLHLYSRFVQPTRWSICFANICMLRLIKNG